MFARFKEHDRLSIISRMHRVQPSVRLSDKKRVEGSPATSARMSGFVVWLAKIGKACCKCRTNPYRYLGESQAQTPIRWIKFINFDLRHFQGTEHREIHACYITGVVNKPGWKRVQWPDNFRPCLTSRL